MHSNKISASRVFQEKEKEVRCKATLTAIKSQKERHILRDMTWQKVLNLKTHNKMINEYEMTKEDLIHEPT